VVLVALGGFSYAISLKARTFLLHPSQIDLTVTYEESLEFPAVYICNPNPYKSVHGSFMIQSLHACIYSRMSSILQHGLYDVVATAYGIQTSPHDPLIPSIVQQLKLLDKKK
jgi:hypothetical protein